MTAKDLLAANKSVCVTICLAAILAAERRRRSGPALRSHPPSPRRPPRRRRPNAPLSSTDAILKWINAYRGKPEPDGLPVLVRALSEMQAFKDAETCGAYIGFIAGVLGANPERAECADREDAVDRAGRSLGAGPRHRLFRACRTGRCCCSSIADRMRDAQRHDRQICRRQIADARSDRLPEQRSPACSTRSKSRSKSATMPKKPVAIDPSPELIDVLWGYYLATGSLSAGRPHHQAAAARQRQGQRRQSHHRQRREVHARQQRRARSASARHAQARGERPARRDAPRSSTT